MRALYAAVLLPLCLVACDKTKETSPTSTTTSTQASTAAPTAAADDGEGIPTEEDFEEEAEQKISAQNVEEELDKLEKEISN